jgi:hypothetical protein
MWILGQGTDHLLRALGGHPGALIGYWNANIFAPEPLTLAYTDHLTLHALQILPLYAITGNVILCHAIASRARTRRAGPAWPAGATLDASAPQRSLTAAVGVDPTTNCRPAKSRTTG